MHGSVSASGRGLGSWNAYPDICRTGERAGFYGIDLYSSANSDFAVRVIQSPENELSVIVRRMTDAGDQGFQFRPKDCRVLHATFERSTGRYDGLFLIKGSFELDCTIHVADSPEHVQGLVDFRACGN